MELSCSQSSCVMRTYKKPNLINGLIVKSKTIIKCPNWLDNVIIGLESWSKHPGRFDQDLVQDRSKIEVDTGAQL